MRFLRLFTLNSLPFNLNVSFFRIFAPQFSKQVYSKRVNVGSVYHNSKHPLSASTKSSFRFRKYRGKSQRGKIHVDEPLGGRKVIDNNAQVANHAPQDHRHREHARISGGVFRYARCAAPQLQAAGTDAEFFAFGAG